MRTPVRDTGEAALVLISELRQAKTVLQAADAALVTAKEGREAAWRRLSVLESALLQLRQLPEVAAELASEIGEVLATGYRGPD